jgi:hypothetical protein
MRWMPFPICFKGHRSSLSLLEAAFTGTISTVNTPRLQNCHDKWRDIMIAD